MNFSVVCISRTLAAGGEALGSTVAQRLGFRYVDDEIVTRAAREAQVDPTLVAAVEHRQPVLKRILDSLTQAASVAGTAVSLSTGIPVDAFGPGSSAYRAVPDDLRALIRAAIHAVARAGQVVIVAHAASMALAGTDGVLRVLVTASADTRARRLAAAQGLAVRDASDAIAASDRERREYFRTFYDIKDELPTHYDVVVNTDVLTTEQGAELLVGALRA